MQWGDKMSGVVVFDFKTTMHDSLVKLTVFCEDRESSTYYIQEEPANKRLAVGRSFAEFDRFSTFLADVTNVYGVWETAPNGQVVHFALQLERARRGERTQAGSE